MKIFSLITASIALTCAAVAQGDQYVEPQPFRLVFTNTELTTVLRAISLRTGANIIFAGKDDVKISINVSAYDASTALKAVSSAAGVVARRANATWVIAPHEMMRQALVPYGEEARISLVAVSIIEASDFLDAALPYLSVRPSVGGIAVTGTKEDISEARSLLSEYEAAALDMQYTQHIAQVRNLQVRQVADLLKAMFPRMQVESVGPADAPGGSVGLAGPKSDVLAAVGVLLGIDVPAESLEPETVFEVYTIRYSSAPLLKAFVEEAAMGVKVFVGPETYAPPAPGFRPLSGGSIGSGSSSGSATNGFAAGSATGTQSTGMTSSTNDRPAQQGDLAKVIVLRGSRAQIDATLDLLAQVDVKPSQVVVEVKVLDISPERAEELGINWNWTRFGFYEVPPGTSVTQNPPGAEFTEFLTRPVDFGQFSRVPWSFTAIINAMITSKEAKILATPSIKVIEGNDANIFIGDTIRAKIAQSGSFGTQTVEIVEFPIGIILLIRPRVNVDGNITLRVHPVVSTITGLTAENVPQTSSREAETTVMVKSGETVVLGGLIREEMTKTVSEIPILSQLPIVGELFRTRSTSSRKSEILVFITTRIVPDDEDQNEAGTNSAGGGGK